jgi:hypothetical protein
MTDERPLPTGPAGLDSKDCSAFRSHEPNWIACNRNGVGQQAHQKAVPLHRCAPRYAQRSHGLFGRLDEKSDSLKFEGGFELLPSNGMLGSSNHQSVGVGTT